MRNLDEVAQKQRLGLICKNRNTNIPSRTKETRAQHSIPVDNVAVKTKFHLKLGSHKVLHMLTVVAATKKVCVALADGPREIQIRTGDPVLTR